MSKVLICEGATHNRTSYHTTECHRLKRAGGTREIEESAAKRMGLTACALCKHEDGKGIEQDRGYYEAAINAGEE